MIEGVYKWIGLVVGGLCALLATSALIQELRSSPDPGSVAFDLVFGAIAAAVAARAGISFLMLRPPNTDEETIRSRAAFSV